MQAGPAPMKALKQPGPRYYDERFEHINYIGYGSYGQVYKVKHRETGKPYAIKKYKNIFANRVLALRTLREVTILRRMKHPKIIKIFDILPPPDINNFNELYVVLQYFPFDLRNLCSKVTVLNDQQIIKITYQLLIVLKYLSSVKILHRDLKPQNILSDQNFNIKLCDFGLARSGLKEPSFKQLRDSQSQPQFMTCHVVSRWYRAPEIILMQNKYDSGIQMWSVACIFGQMIGQHQKNKKINVTQKKRALFDGKACFPLSPPKGDDKSFTYKIQNGFPYSQDDQISKILKMIGTPTQDDLSFVEEQVALNYVKSLPQYKKKRPSEIFNYCLPQWQDFLEKSLVFDPRKRMTIHDAIMHPMFDHVRKMEDFQFEQGKAFDIDLPSEMPLQDIKTKMVQEIMYYQTEMDIE